MLDLFKQFEDTEEEFEDLVRLRENTKNSIAKRHEELNNAISRLTEVIDNDNNHNFNFTNTDSNETTKLLDEIDKISDDLDNLLAELNM